MILIFFVGILKILIYSIHRCKRRKHVLRLRHKRYVIHIVNVIHIVHFFHWNRLYHGHIKRNLIIHECVHSLNRLWGIHLYLLNLRL